MYYRTPAITKSNIPNIWDVISLIIIFSIFASLAFGASHMATPFNLGEQTVISLDPTFLPSYAIRTVLRMLIALLFSFLFTFIVAPLAAKNRQAEKFIIPLIDILQSVPILGMLSITIVAFMQLFPGSLLGPECAAIFAIFTSQVWNMTLSFYQSLKLMPKELYDTAKIFHLSAWQQFWRIELPLATPSLLWNTMISLSGGWFFVVATEAISVSNQNILLPGIGSYIRVAISEANMTAVYYAIFTMLIVILLYDQLLFRPLLTWAERFKPERNEEEQGYQAWFYQFLTKTRWAKYYKNVLNQFSNFFINPPKLFHFPTVRISNAWLNKFREGDFLNEERLNLLWNIVLVIAILLGCFFLLHFIIQTVSFNEIQYVFYLGGITALKVGILVILASLIWIPVGIYIGLRPKLSHFFQPIIQFVAAFPVNLIYPIIVTIIVTLNLNVNIWSSPLMILGTQWYILFNVIAATNAIPQELKLVVQNFGLSKWLQWKRLILPLIFPYYVTGAMATAAGCWNASIVADVLNWGNHHLVATGLGSYIVQHTTTGDFPRIALSVFVMCCFVLVINRLVWQNLYQLAAKRYVLE